MCICDSLSVFCLSLPADRAAPRLFGADPSVTSHMGTGEFKRLVITHVWGAIAAHQAAEAALTPTALAEATRVRELVRPGIAAALPV